MRSYTMPPRPVREITGMRIMARSLHPSFFLVFLIQLFWKVSVQTNCESFLCEYGVGESSCTDGFPSLFHIDTLEKNTKLEAIRNVFDKGIIIPDIKFICNGTITSWIIGAEQEEGLVSLHLEIWRSVNSSWDRKISMSSLLNGRNIGHGLYQYHLAEPLAFQAGDFLGISHNDGEGKLFWEDSKRLTGYLKKNRNDVEVQRVTSKVEQEAKYPLITAITDPLQCGCGFMSLERMTRLINNSVTKSANSKAKLEKGRQIIFPEVMFNCSGEVVKWISGGTLSGDGDSNRHFVQFQIWRETESGVLQLVNSTTAYLTTSEGDSVYEYRADPPIPFQQHDRLGVFQPSESKFILDYDELGSSTFYSISTSYPLESFNPHCSDSNTGDSSSTSSSTSRHVPECHSIESILSGLPLVSVEIATSNSDLCSLTPLTTPTSSCNHCSGHSSVVTSPVTRQGTSVYTQHIISSLSLSSTAKTLQLPSFTPSSKGLAMDNTMLISTYSITTPGPVQMDTTTPVQSIPSSKAAGLFGVDTSILVGLACVVAFNVGICATISIILLKCRHSRTQKLKSTRRSSGGGHSSAASITPNTTTISHPHDAIPIVANKAYTGSIEVVGSNTTLDTVDQPTGFTSSSTGQYELRGPPSEIYYDYPASSTGEDPPYDYPFQHVLSPPR